MICTPLYTIDEESAMNGLRWFCILKPMVALVWPLMPSGSVPQNLKPLSCTPVTASTNCRRYAA